MVGRLESTELAAHDQQHAKAVPKPEKCLSYARKNVARVPASKHQCITPITYPCQKLYMSLGEVVFLIICIQHNVL